MKLSEVGYGPHQSAYQRAKRITGSSQSVLLRAATGQFAVENHEAGGDIDAGAVVFGCIATSEFADLTHALGDTDLTEGLVEFAVEYACRSFWQALGSNPEVGLEVRACVAVFENART